MLGPEAGAGGMELAWLGTQSSREIELQVMTSGIFCLQSVPLPGWSQRGSWSWIKL